MPRFPYLILLYLFVPCLLGIGMGIYILLLLPENKTIWLVVSLFGSVGLGIGLFGLWWFVHQWWNPYYFFLKRIKLFATYNKMGISRRTKRTYWLAPHQELTDLTQHFEDIINFTTALAQKKFDTALSPTLQNSPFAPRLQVVRAQLEAQEREVVKQSWAMRGLAEFGDILRNSEHLGLETLANYCLSQLVKYMNAQQGVMYILNETNEKDKHLQLIANYAIAKTDFDNKRIEINEGLTGECFTKRKFYYIQNIHDDYSPIFSGLGSASPNALLIFPISLPNKTIGVIEMTSWQVYQDYQLHFLESICDNLAVTLDGFYMHAQTETLLKETEKINAELREQEKEMKENAENLEIIQEELRLKLQFIAEETTLLKYILEAINKTNAMIEMDMDGNIVDVNDMYLSVMGYKEDELIGKNERTLLTPEEAASNRYNLMWETLTNGSFISGEYRRIARDGREVWLNGTYNPIFDTEGKPARIMKLAQFITEDKERDLRLNNKINAINQALMIIEVNDSGTIKSVNQSFVTHFQLKRTEVRNLKIEDLLQKDTNNLLIFNTLWEEVIQGNTPLARILAYQPTHKLLTKANTYLSPVKNIFGKLEGFMLVLVNVTEVENTREQLAVYTQTLIKNEQTLKKRLQEESNLLNALWQSAKMFEIDENHKLIRANERFLTKFKFETPDIETLYFNDVIEMLFPKKILTEIWGKVANNGYCEAMLKYQVGKGKNFWGNTTITAYQDIATDTKRYIVVVQDATEQIVKEIYLRGELVELKLKNAILRYQHIFEEGANPTWQKMPQILKNLDKTKFEEVVNTNMMPYMHISQAGKILKVNDLALDALGYQREQLLDKTLDELLIFKNTVEQTGFFEALHVNTNHFEQWLILNNYQGNGLYANTLIKTQNSEHEVFFVIP